MLGRKPQNIVLQTIGHEFNITIFVSPHEDGWLSDAKVADLHRVLVTVSSISEKEPPFKSIPKFAVELSCVVLPDVKSAPNDTQPIVGGYPIRLREKRFQAVGQ